MKCGGRRSWQGDNHHAMCHRRFWLFPNKQTETTASQTKIIQTLLRACYRCTVTTECCERGGDRSTSCRQASAHRALDLFGGGVFLIVLEHWLMDKLLKSMMMMMFITIFAGD